MAQSHSTQPLSLNEYLQSQHRLLTSGDYWNCLTATKVIARYLLAEGRRPWIARLRKTELRSDGVFHARLTPQGLLPLRTWTTHYVCCCDDVAYEPVAGRTVPLESYSADVFGQEIPLEVFVSVADLAEYL
jgi:hypothetical protein